MRNLIIYCSSYLVTLSSLRYILCVIKHALKVVWLQSLQAFNQNSVGIERTMLCYCGSQQPIKFMSQFGKRALLFADLRCGIVSQLQFVMSTVIQLSDVHSSHIYLAVHFPHDCYLIYALTL